MLNKSIIFIDSPLKDLKRKSDIEVSNTEIYLLNVGHVTIRCKGPKGQFN